VLKLNTHRCTFFQWAEFDEDGNPPWAMKPGLKSVTESEAEAEAEAQEGSGVEK
jgi:hypothetical protein